MRKRQRRLERLHRKLKKVEGEAVAIKLGDNNVVYKVVGGENLIRITDVDGLGTFVNGHKYIRKAEALNRIQLVISSIKANIAYYERKGLKL